MELLGLRMEAVRRDYARMRLPYRPVRSSNLLVKHAPWMSSGYRVRLLFGHSGHAARA
jgi:hypothetical protein